MEQSVLLSLLEGYILGITFLNALFQNGTRSIFLLNKEDWPLCLRCNEVFLETPLTLEFEDKVVGASTFRIHVT